MDERVNVEGLEPLVKRDPREAFRETEGFIHPEVRSTDGPVCVLCESGYHDHAWETGHVMKCGCPCHHENATAAGA